MDLAGDRAAIVAALSTAPDVTGHLDRPVMPRLGDAWALPGVMERGPGRSFEVSWRVLVFLAQQSGGPTAFEWVDAHVEQIVDALEPLVFVDRIEVVTLAEGDAAPFALQFTVRSE